MPSGHLTDAGHSSCSCIRSFHVEDYRLKMGSKMAVEGPVIFSLAHSVIVYRHCLGESQGDKKDEGRSKEGLLLA